MYLSPVTKGEIWKMKSFKKLFAMLLAVVMVVGVVNLPTKAAGETAASAIQAEFSIHINRENLLTLTIAGVTNPSNEPGFTAISSDAEVTYNGVKCTRTNQPRMTQWGMYLAVDEVSNSVKTAAVAGDLITLSGIWQYSVDGKYYDFGNVTFYWNGSSWEALGTVTDVTLAIHGGQTQNTGALVLTATGMTVAASGEPTFTAVSGDAQVTYNGVKCTQSNTPRTIPSGVYLGVSDVSNGEKVTVETNDIIALSGIWKYTHDGKYYNFGNVSYKWSGTTWQEVTPFTITGMGEYAPQTEIDGGRWFFNLNTSVDIKGTAYSTDIVEPEILVNGTATDQVYMYPNENKDLAMFVRFAGLAQTPATGTTVTIKAGMMGEYELKEDYAMVWNGSTWMEVTPFTITGVGNCANQDFETLHRWLLRFNTSAAIAGGDFATHLADATILVNETEKTVSMHSAENDGLGVIVLFTDLAKSPDPETTVTIKAGAIGNYLLTEDYKIVYRDGVWQEYSTVIAKKAALTIHANNNTAISFTVDQIANPESGEPEFTKFDSSSVLTYNGDDSLKAPRMTKLYGLYFAPSEMASNRTSGAIAGDVITFGGIWKYAGDNAYYKFDTVSYRFNGSTWNLYTANSDFTITGIGDCGAQPDVGEGRWLLRLKTSNSITGEGHIADATVQVTTPSNVTSDHTASYYVSDATGHVNVYIPFTAVPLEAEGYILTIPQGYIGTYNLQSDYQLIYRDGEWQEYHEATSITLTGIHPTFSDKDRLRFIASQTVSLATNEILTPIYSDAGIWINGKKWDVSTGIQLVYNADGVSYYDLVFASFGTKAYTPSEDDIVTLKGTFQASDGTYWDFSEWSAICNVNSETQAVTWEKSVNYSNFHRVQVKSIVTSAWRENDWLFRVEATEPFLEGTGDFNTSDMLGTVSLTITDTSNNEKTISTAAYYAAANDGAEPVLLGFVIGSGNLPETADGYKVTLNKCRLASDTQMYKITTPYTWKYVSSVWVQDTAVDRPAPSGIRGDANGDDELNAIDLVRALREFQNVGGTYATTDALMVGKSRVTKSDVVKIKEILLQGSSTDDLPVYLDDDDIQLAAYMGPRAQNRDFRYDNGVAKSGYETKSFLTEPEFKRYADAGFNTLIAEGDAPFVSEGDNLMEATGGHWANLANYMTLAKEAGLDVYVQSEALNAYLKGVQATTNGSNQVDVTDTFLAADIKQMLYGNGKETNKGLLSFDNFKGILMADELHYEHLDAYRKATELIRSEDPDIEFFNSQLSMVTDLDLLGAGWWDSIFVTNENRVKYFKNYAKEMGLAANSFTYDLYSLRSDQNGSNQYVQEDWLENLQISATQGKENGFETGITIQSTDIVKNTAKEYYRTPSAKKDIGFQVYTALAYGMKSVNYFTYWGHYTQGENTEYFTTPMIQVDNDGNAIETAVYSAVQKINRELLQFDHVFLDYDWQSTIHVGTSNDSLFGDLTQGSSDRINNYSSESNAAAIIGCMHDPDKNLDGFWIVNATAPEDDLSNTVTVTFNNATRALVYNPAQNVYGELEDLTNGVYTARLGSGEGQFIIPLP